KAFSKHGTLWPKIRVALMFGFSFQASRSRGDTGQVGAAVHVDAANTEVEERDRAELVLVIGRRAQDLQAVALHDPGPAAAERAHAPPVVVHLQEEAVVAVHARAAEQLGA